MWPSLVNAIKDEYNAIRIWPRADPSVDMNFGQNPPLRSAYEIHSRASKSTMPFGLGIHRDHNLRISHRTSLNQHSITLHGWPSRGGVIILEDATPPDFDFLHLDALDPPLRRDPDQTAEDTFCRGLLRLGATWWDSEKRRNFVHSLEDGDEKAHEAIEANENLQPTRRECGWVRVAWPSNPPGALCVLACDKVVIGRSPDMKLRPRHYGIVSLARTMDERFTVLQRLGGTVYASIDEYQGSTFLKAWEDNHQGERGRLKMEEFNNPAMYRGHQDDALEMGKPVFRWD